MLLHPLPIENKLKEAQQCLDHADSVSNIKSSALLMETKTKLSAVNSLINIEIERLAKYESINIKKIIKAFN